MLPLDSPRWKSFSTHFGSPEQVPMRLAAWRLSIGTPDENAQWTELCETFLHQYSITDAAFAVVPHVVQELPRIEPKWHIKYLAELALIDSARQRGWGESTLPCDLSHSYHAAIGNARRFSVELLALEWPPIDFRSLISVLAVLHGHAGLGDLILHLACIYGQCTKCGELVFPERIQLSGYA